MFFLNLDVKDLLNLGTELSAASKKALNDAGKRLTAMTRAHIVEQANKRLHSRREMYIDALTHFQVDENTWIISLDARARWIEDGMKPHSMLDDLLRSKKAKTAKDGSKYMVVPFQHNKGPTQMTPAQKTLLATIKKELTTRKIPYGKTETNADGSAKTGLLHAFDIKTAPLKSANSPGQGKGPVGQVMQGPTGIPLLKGVRIFQRETENKDGSKSVRRDIMTFRVASSKHKDQGRWEHPGLEGVKLMDEAYDWAKTTWEKDIIPQLREQLSNGL
jgi:hypothetical protein